VGMVPSRWGAVGSVDFVLRSGHWEEAPVFSPRLVSLHIHYLSQEVESVQTRGKGSIFRDFVQTYFMDGF